jgi:hypothetical protein
VTIIKDDMSADDPREQFWVKLLIRSSALTRP